MILDTIIALVVIALAVKLIRNRRRHAQQIAIGHALNRALAPQPLIAKYACVMSADEVKAMNAARWD